MCELVQGTGGLVDRLVAEGVLGDLEAVAGGVGTCAAGPGPGGGRVSATLPLEAT